VCLGLTQLLAVEAGIDIAVAQRHALNLIRTPGALSGKTSDFARGRNLYQFLADVAFPLNAIDNTVYVTPRVLCSARV